MRPQSFPLLTPIFSYIAGASAERDAVAFAGPSGALVEYMGPG